MKLTHDSFENFWHISFMFHAMNDTEIAGFEIDESNHNDADWPVWRLEQILEDLYSKRGSGLLEGIVAV